VPIRYTRSGDTVNTLVLGTPETDRVVLDMTVADGATITGSLGWQRVAHGTAVRLREACEPAVVLRISPAAAVS
jgi:hypothetical protein